MFFRATGQKPILNLATAAESIDQFIKKHDSRSLTQKQKQDLYQFVKRMTAIEHILSGWLAGGRIASYHLNEARKALLQNTEEFAEGAMEMHITQKDLFEEAQIEHFKMFNFTYFQIKDLQRDWELLFETDDLKERKDARALYHFVNKRFSVMLQSIEDRPFMPKNIEEKEKIKTSKIELSEEEKYFFMGEDIKLRHACTMAQSLGAKFYPFSQMINPLLGKEEGEKTLLTSGICAGLTRAWIDEIKKTGKCLKQPVGNQLATYYQLNQTAVDNQASQNNQVKYFEYLKIENELIYQVLNHIDEDSVYELSTIPSNNNAHSMGIRKLKNGQIEFYDPNIGLIVFPRRNDFHVWFQYSGMLEFYIGNVPGMISLINFGKQNNQAVASIPLDNNAEEAYCHLDRLISQASSYHHFFTTKPKIWSSYNFHKVLPISEYVAGKLNKEDEVHQKLTDAVYAVFESESGLRLISNWEQHNQLKSLVIAQLDIEIKRLENIWFDKNNKAAAFRELRQRIEDAILITNLETLVYQWLHDKPIDHDKTYGEMIATHRFSFDGPTDSYLFILKLVDKYEINPLKLEILQMELLAKIMQLSEHLGEVFPKVAERERYSPGELLEAMKKSIIPKRFDWHLLSQSSTTGLQQKILKIIQTTDVVSPKSLREATSSLVIIQQSFEATPAPKPYQLVS